MTQPEQRVIDTTALRVIDASALLAAIHQEPGGVIVKQHIEQSIISAINWSEVLQKLSRAGADSVAIAAMLKALGLRVVAFTEDDAQLAADLWPETKKKGLSLADRACLALGKRLQLTVVTADKAWQGVDPDIVIELIR